MPFFLRLQSGEHSSLFIGTVIVSVLPKLFMSTPLRGGERNDLLVDFLLPMLRCGVLDEENTKNIGKKHTWM